jgi:capsular polysaccharide biosynthesis protein
VNKRLKQNFGSIFEMYLCITNIHHKMKKIILSLAVVAIAAVSFTSCKKDYTCTCTILGQASSTTYEKTTKDDAQSKCDAANTGAALLGGSCKLD